MRRAAVIVMDACGVGALPDAAAYGDEGTNTLAHLAELAGGLQLPVMGSLGLGSIVPIQGVPPAASPVLHGRVGAVGPGKESTTGHWELMGVRVDRALWRRSSRRPRSASAATGPSVGPLCSTNTEGTT